MARFGSVDRPLLFALVVAATAHCCVLTAAWIAPAPPAATLTVAGPRHLLEADIEWDTPVEHEARAGAASLPSRRTAARRATQYGPPASPTSEPLAEGPGEQLGPTAEDGSGPSESEPPRRSRVELGLDGALTRHLLREQRDTKPRRTPPRDVLAEGMAARIAQQGSAAVPAAYLAAASAPAQGTATFEVRADRSGNVLSVTLVSFGEPEAAWHRVAENLRRQLSRRKLPARPGTAGTALTVRIDRGALAGEVPAKSKTTRGPGVSHSTLGPRDVADDSTRASLEPGRPTPTLGASVGGSSQATRVVVLSSRSL